MNQQFRQAVTSTAFSLTLSRQMIIALVSIHSGDRSRMDVFRYLGMVDSSCTSAAALLHRGLVYAPDLKWPGVFKLTRAGELLMELLEEADLVRGIRSALKKKDALNKLGAT